MASADSFDGFDIASRSTTSATSNTNIPPISDINAITPGTIFNDDLPPSFLDAADTDYPSSSSSSPPPSTQSTTNKSGGGGGHIGQIEVNSTIQTILVILGFAVGALFLLGVVAMYFITHKNRRAEEKKKVRDEEAVAKAAVAKSVRNSVSSHTHPTLTGGNGTGGGGGSGGGGGGGGITNNPHRIIITRSMTATTAHTRIGTCNGPGSDEKNGGGAVAGGVGCGSGAISPIGDGKSDMVTIYIDDTPEDEILARKHHHCDNDDDDEDDSGMGQRMNEKQELDEGIVVDGSQQEREGRGTEMPSQEHNRNLTHPYPAPH